MNKGWIVLAAVAVVIAVGAFYVMVGDGTGAGVRSAEELMEGEMSTPNGDSSVVSGSMQDLMARGGSWKCEFSHTTDAGTSMGTVYGSEGMMRGNFTSEVPQMGTVESHMIARDGFIYTWSDAMPQGVKLPMTSAQASAQTQGQTNFYAQKLDYNCVSWTTDPSQFAVPTSVTFMQFGQ